MSIQIELWFNFLGSQKSTTWVSQSFSIYYIFLCPERNFPILARQTFPTKRKCCLTNLCSSVCYFWIWYLCFVLHYKLIKECHSTNFKNVWFSFVSVLHAEIDYHNMSASLKIDTIHLLLGAWHLAQCLFPTGTAHPTRTCQTRWLRLVSPREAHKDQNKKLGLLDSHSSAVESLAIHYSPDPFTEYFQDTA